MMKLKNWHILIVVILMFFVYKAGMFGFMGALSGICTSQEPVEVTEMLAPMKGWVISEVNGSV